MPGQFGAVHRITVTPADVGARVTLRRSVGGEVGDVVGELLSWSDGVLTVRTRRKGDVRVAEETLLAGRLVG